MNTSLSRRRSVSAVTVWALLLQMLGVAFLVAPPAQAPAQAANNFPSISVVKSAPASIIPGQQPTYKITVTNNGNANVEYNVSISDLLPQDAKYVATVAPSTAGAPQVSKDPVTGRQVVIWRGLANLAKGESVTLEFTADLGPEADIVGATFANDAWAGAASDDRVVPTFDSSGKPIAGTKVQTAQSPQLITKVTAFAVSKSGGNPLRGVHDQRGVYTISVDNSGKGATNNVVVTDYIPAALEFLGCGNVDNTTPDTSVEYPGAPRLGVPPLSPSPCPTPASVETVANPAGYPAGIYTKVVWNLGNLPLNTTTQIQYVTGSPLRANALFSDPVPTPASLLQAANLNNNTGASTQETTSAQSATNFVTATGTYQGPIKPGVSRDVSASANATQPLEDLIVSKAISPGAAPGSIVTFTFTIKTSEYVTAKDIVLTDKLGDGFCPIGTGAPCDDGGRQPSLPYQSVTQDPATGGYTIVFQPTAVTSKNGTTTVTFPAKFLTNYNTFGPNAGLPIVAKDSVGNSVSLTGTTVPAANTGEPEQTGVTAESSTGVGLAGISFSKLMKPRAVPMDCDPTVNPDYATDTSLDPTTRQFRYGDVVCFKLRVDFPSNVPTLNARLIDFLPFATDYVEGSWTNIGNVPIRDLSTNPDIITLALGTESPAGSGKYYVPAGGRFEAYFAVRIVEPAPGPGPEPAANVATVSFPNTAGSVTSISSDAEYTSLPAPPVSMQKGVYTGSNPPLGPNGPNVDGSIVRQDSTATFRLDISNPETGDFNYPIRAVQTYDVLPPGISCSAISDYQYQIAPTTTTTLTLTPLPGGIAECYDPGTGPAVTATYGDRTKQALIVWTFPSPDAIGAYDVEPGSRMTLTYAMKMPSQISVTTVFPNKAAVSQFESFTNEQPVNGLAPLATYFPDDNINPDNVSKENAGPVTDGSSVRTADAGITKTQTTQIDTTFNNAANQATIGERVTYTVSATIPSQTTVFNGVLSDALPAELALLGVTATGPGGGPLPPGFTLDTSAAKITFPATYNNDTNADQVFQMVLTAQVKDIPNNNQNDTRRNTAAFNSNLTLGGTALPARTAQTAVTIVEPSPTVTKSPSTNTVIGGQTVTYTITVGNAANRPPQYDVTAVDCLPPLLSFQTVTENNGGGAVTTEEGNGTNGCQAGWTAIKWNVGAAVPPTYSLKYTALVSTQVVGGTQLSNTVTTTGTSMPGVVAGERTYTKAASATINVSNADVVKGISKPQATIGEKVTYTVTGTLKANVNYYEVSVLDTLPAGLDPNVTFGPVTCTGAGCAEVTANPNFGTALTRNGQVIGVYIGDALTSPEPRVISFTYETTVLNVPSNKAGVVLNNSARVYWSTDPNASPPTSVTQPPTLPGAKSNGPAVAGLTILEPAISVAKGVFDNTPQPTQPFTYTINVSNANTQFISTAYGVVVTDTVPVGVVVDPATISNGGALTGNDPTTGGGTITWNFPQIGKGVTVPLTYTATLAPSNTLTAIPLTNAAKATTWFSLPDPSTNPQRRQYGPSNTATASVFPQFPRIAVEKSMPNGSEAFLGKPFTWQLKVTNTGGADAIGVDVNDALPVNWCFVPDTASVTLPGGTPTAVAPAVTGECTGSPINQLLDWTNLGNLAPGQFLTITFQAQPTQLVTTTPGVGLSVKQTNTAQGIADDLSGANANKTGPYTAGPGTAAAGIRNSDLVITKVGSPNPATAGQPATFTINVQNAGPDPSVAGLYTVTDELPPQLANPVATGNGWTCTTNGLLITCTTTTTTPLAAGASLPPITVTGQIPTTIGNGTVLQNTATVTGPTLDTDPLDNTVTALLPVQRVADLAITKTASPTPNAVPGESVTFTLSVVNKGPSDADGPVTVTDTLPSPLQYSSFSGSGWSCTAAGQVLTCILDAGLPAGSTSQILVTATIPASASGETITNTATVTSTTTDNNLTNNSSSVDVTLKPTADLFVDKSGGTPLVAGEETTYTLKVGNLGPSDSGQPITLVDTLPAGLSYVSATADSGWVCSASGQVVTCTYPLSLAPQVNAPDVALTALVAADFSGDALNSATVTGPEFDPDSSNNTDSVGGQPGISADLAVVKSAAPSTLVPGEAVTYTVTVTNNGPSVSPAGFTVTDTLPAGLTLVGTPSGDGWTCTTGVSCVYGQSLGVGSSATFTIVADVASGVTGSVSNTATVSSSTPDPKPDNNSATSTNGTAPVASLVVAKQTVPDADVAVVPGTNVTYRITVTNDGPSDAAAPLTVTDTLPAGATYVLGSGAGWSCPEAPAASPVTCTSDTVLPAKGFTTIDVVVALAPGVTGDVVNTATATSPTDPDGGTGTSTNPAAPSADLQVVKTTVTDPVVPGQEVTYEIAVKNNGPSTAQGTITVTDALDPVLTLQSAAGLQPGWSCTGAATVTCEYAGSLAPNVSAPTIKIVAALSPDHTGELANTATVAGPTPDPIPGNNSSTTTGPSTGSADLQVTKTASPSPVVPGGQVSFTVVVTNDGPSAAQSVRVEDLLDPALTLVSAAGTGWTCDATVACLLSGTLASGASAEPITIVASLPASYTGATLPNTATVSSTTADPDQKNNSSTIAPPVVASADLSLVKETLTDPVVPGQQVEYLLTVANAGPSDAAAPTVTDTLPAGAAFVSGTGANWTCTASGSTVTCASAAVLAAGASSPIKLLVDLAADVTGEVTNTAKVGSATKDPDTGNNTGTTTDTAAPAADLAVVKTTTSDVVPGEDVTYQIVVSNDGPSVSRGPITVTDALDPALTFVSAGGDGWVCTDAVSCTYGGDIADGESAPAITVVATLDAGTALTSLVNTAVLQTTTPDPNGENNTSTVTDTVEPSADLVISKVAKTDPVVPGEDVTYEITVVNEGPSTARAPIVVTDALDPALKLVSAAGDGWVCSGSVSCTYSGDLAVDGEATITVVATLDSSFTGDLTNVASVSGGTPDPDPGSNESEVTVPTDPSADLSMTKETLTEEFLQGGPVSYSLTVANAGPSDAGPPITVTDTLAEPLTFVSATGGGWDCSAEGQTVTCVRETSLPAGDTAPVITVNATLAESFFGELGNTAEVVSETPDPEGGNDSSTVTDQVPPRSDLSMTKTAVGKFVVGSRGAFLLSVSNAGPTADPGPVTVTDVLPAGLGFVSANGDGWDCSAQGQEITCVREAELPVGDAPGITVLVDVLAAASPGVTNSADVSSPSPDPDPDNNGGEVTVVVTVPPGKTPDTGADVGLALLLGVLALLAGGTALAVTRRRR